MLHNINDLTITFLRLDEETARRFMLRYKLDDIQAVLLSGLNKLFQNVF